MLLLEKLLNLAYRFACAPAHIFFFKTTCPKLMVPSIIKKYIGSPFPCHGNFLRFKGVSSILTMGSS